LKGLKLAKEDHESSDYESDIQTRWFIKKHALNPDFLVNGEHYDEDSLVEQNPR
jgi:hypothetical protein